MPHFKLGGELDDVQVLGEWNFTLQADTPLYWLKSGALDFYLLKFRVSTFSPCTWGVVFHAELDGSGQDGVLFWEERRAANGDTPASKRYVLSGEGLESAPVVTRSFDDGPGSITEPVEILVQGYRGVIFLQNRQVHINFKSRLGRGSVAFFNTTQTDGDDDVHFSNVTITAMRKGPLEVDGILSRREKAMMGVKNTDYRFKGDPPEVVEKEEEDMVANELSPDAPVHVAAGGAPTQVSPKTDVTASTAFPSPQQTVTRWTGLSSTKKTVGYLQEQAASPGLRATMPAGGRMSGRGPVSPQQQRMARTTGAAMGRQSRLRQSASDSVLRKTGGTMCGSSVATLRGTKGSRGGDECFPLALNPVAKETHFMKNVFWREMAQRKPGACSEFIPM